jgi:antitoxin VapB
METAKLFYSGNSQAVRLPKEFRFREDRVYIKRVANAVVLLPYDDPWRSLLDGIGLFSDDFMQTRVQGEVEKREQAFE